jgi:hypothetical protein
MRAPALIQAAGGGESKKKRDRYWATVRYAYIRAKTKTPEETKTKIAVTGCLTFNAGN